MVSPPPFGFAPLTSPTSPTKEEVGQFPISHKGVYTNHAPPPPSWGRAIRAAGEERVGG